MNLLLNIDSNVGSSDNLISKGVIMCGFLYLKDITKDQFTRALGKIKHRGPDSTIIKRKGSSWLGFNRLAIMDLNSRADQPFSEKPLSLMCNGEIYNYKSIKKLYSHYNYNSRSDCEVILPLFIDKGIRETCEVLDGEYAFVILDELSDKVFAARDPMGIKPLFYGEASGGELCFASEVKSLQGFVKKILPFPPGHFYDGEKIVNFHDHSSKTVDKSIDYDSALVGIRTKLEIAVVKRLKSDAKLGFLLSGGLDSSLVCSIAQKHSSEPIKTFAIGMSKDAIDLKYAKEVAEFIGSDHTEVIMEKEDVLTSVQEVIYALESWDITSIRASVGMYLVCKHIKENTDIKVLLTGEVSDEIFGYKYTDFAPNAREFQLEAAKRVQELYMYDVLRADRCISSQSLEARVPFSDKDFVDFVMSIDPQIKMNTYGQGKFLLRKAFEGDYLPDSILYREKAAFSDAVGHSMVDYLKEYAQDLYTQKEYLQLKSKYKFKAPFTKESLMYRQIFEEFYPNRAKLIKDYWMPNKLWKNCDVADPSARVLPNYGKSAA